MTPRRRGMSHVSIALVMPGSTTIPVCRIRSACGRSVRDERLGSTTASDARQTTRCRRSSTASRCRVTCGAPKRRRSCSNAPTGRRSRRSASGCASTSAPGRADLPDRPDIREDLERALGRARDRPARVRAHRRHRRSRAPLRRALRVRAADRVMAHADDVTELRELEERLRAVIATIESGLLTVGPAGAGRWTPTRPPARSSASRASSCSTDPAVVGRGAACATRTAGR